MVIAKEIGSPRRNLNACGMSARRTDGRHTVAIGWHARNSARITDGTCFADCCVEMRGAIAIFVILLTAGVHAAGLDEGGVPHSLVKAVFLYNFARFTEWPPAASKGPLTLCVLGDPDVASSLDSLIGDRQLNGREVSVASLATFRIVQSCHLLYVRGADRLNATAAFDAVAGLPVFTVGDGQSFARTGGVAALFDEDGRHRFAINPEALTRAGLRMSSKALGLARVVKEETR